MRSASRRRGQLTTEPPWTQREPRTRSAVAQRGEQPGQLLGLVRAVGVHLDEDVVAVGPAPSRTPARYAAPRPSLPARCRTLYLRRRRRPARRRAGRCRPGCCRRRRGRRPRARPRGPARRCSRCSPARRTSARSRRARPRSAEGAVLTAPGSWVGSGSVERASIARRWRSPVATARPSATSATAVATHSGPRRAWSATVIVSRSGTGADEVRRGLNSGSDCTTCPSGAMTALMPAGGGDEHGPAVLDGAQPGHRELLVGLAGTAVRRVVGLHDQEPARGSPGPATVRRRTRSS